MSDSYLPFHRKYRPKTVKEYIGNDRLKKSTLAALKEDKWPQVMLFTGGSGGGKTTFARLLAKDYLCENRDPDIGACGECDSCRRMEDYIGTGDAGILMNLKEVDITDARCVDSISSLIEDMEEPSYDGSWKVFILDECHVMSNAAQNRLLKPIEEPADKVLILLCTTDPEKLLPTIISRCQYIHRVEKPNRNEMCEFLAKICLKEGIEREKISGRALSMVAVKGGFAFRKTLIELERVLREAKEISYERTCEILETVVDTEYFTFYDCILGKSPNSHQFISFLGRLKQSVDLGIFLDGLTEFTIRGIYVANDVAVEALDSFEVKKYRELFKKIKVEDLALILDRLVKIRKSKDIEFEFMLLGYRGFRGVSMATGVSNDLSLGKEEVSKEKNSGAEQRQDNITMTEALKQEIIEGHLKPASLEGIAKQFNGKVVNTKGLPKL